VIRLAVLVLLVLAAPVRAGTVTVVATGDAALTAIASKQVEAWLRGHGHTIAAPLTVEATNTLVNCMTMDDQGCARGVVDTQSKGESVLYASVIKSRTNDAIILNIYWFPKGKEPIGMRRACEECTNDLQTSTLDEMLSMILGASKLERGRIALHSKPEGMTVLLDNETIGVTPLEREVPAGEHSIVLMHRGQRVGERTLKVHADVTAEITIPVTIPTDTNSGGSGVSGGAILGGVVMGLGGAALATGIALYFTSEEDTGEKLYYRDTKPLGIGLAAGGAVAAGIGVWLFLRARGSDDDEGAPTVSITHDSGVIGWSRAF